MYLAHPQPHHGRAPAEQGLGNTELAPASDQVMIPNAGSAPLARWPDQEATKVRVGEKRGHSSTAATVDGLHQARRLAPTECYPISFGGSECRTGVVGMSPRKRYKSDSSGVNEKTWNTLLARLPAKDHATVSPTAAELRASPTP